VDGLRTEFKALTETMNDGDPLKDNSFIKRYQESLDSFESKALVKLKESKEYENISEAAYLYSGGFTGISPEQDRFFQIAAREKAKYSPHIRNIKNTVRESIVPSDVKIDIPNDLIDSDIEKTLSDNKFQKRLKGWVENCFVDGEIFPLVFVRRDGTIKIRQVDPQEITEFERHPEDKETILTYTREYDNNEGLQKVFYQDFDYEIQIEDEIDGYQSENDFMQGVYCTQFKYGYRDYERCEIPLQPILRYDRIYSDLLMDLARLYHERSRVVWILKVRSGKQGSVDRSTLPFRDSVIKIETDDKTWRIEDPHLSDFNSKEYGHPHKLAVAAGVGFPEYLVFSDSSNSSYATLRSATGPFKMFEQSTQSMWSDNLESFIRFIIRKKVEKKVLPEYVIIERPPLQEVLKIVDLLKTGDSVKLQEAVSSIQEIEKENRKVKTVDIPITVIFPKNMGDNPLLFAQATSILVQAGIISQRTARKWVGVDPDIEALLVKYNTSMDVKTGSTEQPETNLDNKLRRDTV
jgi:hypothetical protein